MEETIVLWVFIIAVLIALMLHILCGYVASQKGRSAFGWFILSLFITPIVALIALAAIGDNKKAP
ncbi:MAG: hypothetical protein ACRC8W_19320 [Plesiomonas shigelloides]